MVTSLLRGVVFGGVHCPDDDDLLQALGRGGWRPQLLHQSVEGVRVDCLLLVGFEGHLVGGGDSGVNRLRLEALNDGGGCCSGSVSGGDVSGDGVCRWRSGFGVGGGWFRVGRLAFGDGDQTFVFLGEFALNEGHRMTGGQEDDCSHTNTKLATERKLKLKCSLILLCFTVSWDPYRDIKFIARDKNVPALSCKPK